MSDEPVTIAGKDGDDAPRYLEKQVDRVLQKLKKFVRKSITVDFLTNANNCSSLRSWSSIRTVPVFVAPVVLQ